MATNPHFDTKGIPRELALNESLIIEAIQAHGVDVQYIPRSITTTDDILNEVIHSTFEKSFKIEMRVEGFEGWAPNSFVLDKLGIGFSANNLTAWVSKTRFVQEVPSEVLTVPGKPNEGDLIYIPHVQLLLEIKKTDTEDPFKSGGKLHAYKLDCEIFKSSSEPMPKTEEFMSDMFEMSEEILQSPEIDTPEAEITKGDQTQGDNEHFEKASDDLVVKAGR